MSTPADDPMNFEQIIDELEALVARLEADDLALEQALALYERGVRLAVQGDGLLQGVEHRVEALRAALSQGATP